MTIKTIQQDTRNVHAWDYKDGTYNIRTEIEVWETELIDGKPVGEPVMKGHPTIHRGVIVTNPVLEDDGSVNEEGLTVTERNQRGTKAQLDALAAETIGEAAIVQSGIIAGKDSEIQSERTQKEAKIAECTRHEARIVELESSAIKKDKNIERLEKVIAELKK